MSPIVDDWGNRGEAGGKAFERGGLAILLALLIAVSVYALLDHDGKHARVVRPSYVVKVAPCSVGRCRILLPGQSLTDSAFKGSPPAIFTAGGKRLTAYPERYAGDAACPQYSLDDGPTVVGFVTCNNEVFVYGKRPVLVAYGEGN